MHVVIAKVDVLHTYAETILLQGQIQVCKHECTFVLVPCNSAYTFWQLHHTTDISSQDENIQ